MFSNKNLPIPDYTRGEEIFNWVSHLVGILIGLAVTMLCNLTAASHSNARGIVCGSVFGLSMILLYTVSSVYHSLPPGSKAKRVLRVLDHCSIYILIAGTYTPIALCSLYGVSRVSGTAVFAFIWIAAAVGIILNLISVERFKVPSMICYIGMGWCIVITFLQAVKAIGWIGMGLMLAGGILYTIGAVFYLFGKKCRYIHSVFHLFVLAGSIIQAVAIILYVM